MNEIDLNADLGEGCGDDAALMGIVTSANIACGAHAGDEETMRETVRLAQRNGVAVGAHPSFPDRENFGRIDMQRAPHEIYEDVRSQIEALAEIAREEGATLHHVKAHGALYNLAARDVAVADAISRAVADVSTSLLVYGLAGGRQIESARAHGLRTAGEGFADRRYMSDGSLVPRARPDALIDDEEEAVQQALTIVDENRAETICLHGDAPHAIAFARRIREAFTRANITIRALAILLAILTLPIAAHATASPTAQAVLATEGRWVQAIDHQDATTLAAILGDNFVHTNYQGRVSYRDQELKRVLKPKPYRQNTSEQTVDVVGTVAIVHGLNTITQNGRTVLRLRYTDVYAQRSGKWRAVCAQETAIAQ